MYELWNDKGSGILKSWIGLNVVFDNIFLQVLYWSREDPPKKFDEKSLFAPNDQLR